MPNTVLIHETKDIQNSADRISIAIASSAYFTFSKKVIILPLSSKYEPKDVLIGKRIKANTIKSREISFNDDGMDALFRRGELEELTEESFSDYCFKASKKENGFDIASKSNKPDLEEFLLSNELLIKKIVLEANKVYDLVILLADSKNDLVIKMLEKIASEELTIISQGAKEEYVAKKDSLFAINDYDSASIFTYKEMKKIYSIEDNTKLYPVPYNIHFKDSCRKESAIDFMTSNVSPEKNDENFIFIEQINNLTSAILKTEIPLIKERNFVDKKVTRRTK